MSKPKTWLDFLALGCKMAPGKSGEPPRVLGPEGRDDLYGRLRFLVETKRTHSAETPKGTLRPYQCDLCGDPLGKQAGGWCGLCSLARAKDLAEYGGPAWNRAINDAVDARCGDE